MIEEQELVLEKVVDCADCGHETVAANLLDCLLCDDVSKVCISCMDHHREKELRDRRIRQLERLNETLAKECDRLRREHQESK